MSAHESFPNLRQFLGGYFHQDWMHDAPDPDGIIRLFVAETTREVLADVRTELNYVVPPSSMRYFDGLEGTLPGLDASHGITPGVGNPYIGPVIRFEPEP
jgi:hypothetical protein